MLSAVLWLSSSSVLIYLLQDRECPSTAAIPPHWGSLLSLSPIQTLLFLKTGRDFSLLSSVEISQGIKEKKKKENR